MTRDDVLDFCATFTGAIEDYPFGDEVAVFKVEGKIFALVMLNNAPGFVNLKCDPELAMALREQYAAVRPGYHTNKRHWNSVDLDGSIPSDRIREMIEHSYDLVVARLPRTARTRLGHA
jgi:predicted DNA-binding protein (MmcQ/YjbR family)